VPVFADTTARDAAFGGTGEKVLAEGQLAYIEASDVVQYYNGSTWATLAPASAGALVYLTGATFTAVSSVSLANSTFTSTYRNYKIVYQFAASANDAAVTLRLRASGTDESSANYYYGLNLTGVNATNYPYAGSGTTSFGTNISYTSQQAYDFTLYSPQIAQNTNISGTLMSRVTGVGPAGGSVGGVLLTSTQYDSLSLIIASGTMTGTYRVYGLADS
jgi:hypothetical protein